MNASLILPPGYRQQLTAEQMRLARDRALAKAKAEYEAARRQILREYRLMQENSGFIPERKNKP